MKVFLSWSGKRSYAAAEALADWLPQVINAVDPWLSTEIEKGSPSMTEIAASLNGCSFGIVCVTPGNQARPWINYEAGALAKTVGNEKGRVATVLIGIERPTEVTGPLSQFQATLINLKDIKRLVRDIDSHTDNPRPAAKLDEIVDALWPFLEPKLQAAVDRVSSRPPQRSDAEKIDELLTITRDLKRTFDNAEISATVHLGRTDNNARFESRGTRESFKREVFSYLAPILGNDQIPEARFSWSGTKPSIELGPTVTEQQKEDLAKVILFNTGVNIEFL